MEFRIFIRKVIEIQYKVPNYYFNEIFCLLDIISTFNKFKSTIQLKNL